MVSLTINGKNVEALEGSTVLQAAEGAGITIPTLCYHKDLSPFGGCRLCLVEVQKMRLPATACNLPVDQGMVVQSESPALTQSRRSTLEMLLRYFYDASYKRSNGAFDLDADTQFAHWVRTYGIDIKSAMAQRPRYPIDSDPNPFVWVDMNKCIMCTRCVRACGEVQGRFVWNQAYRGNIARIVAGTDSTLLQSRCESCGACVAYCPTGALDNKMSVSLGRPDRLVGTTCPYCGVGCQFYLNVKNDVHGERVIRVTSNPDSPINGMHLCVKGRYGYDFIHRDDRLMRPRVRKYLLDGLPRSKNRGKWVEVDWDSALKIVADRLNLVHKEYGPDAIGLLASGKLLNEENYLMNKLARQVLGTNNIDCCEHLCRSSVVDGLDISFGLGVMSNSLEDVANNARSMLIIGSDTTEQHPVFGAKIRQAVLQRGTKLVVASPLFINIEEYAVLPVRYSLGSEVALLNGLMYIILEKGWENSLFIQDRTDGFDAFKTVIDKYPPERVAEITGVPVEALYQVAEILATNRPMAVIWGSGVAHPVVGVRNVMALANLQMLLGNMGLSGGGVVPLRSQNNSQGACDMGGLPGFYPGYQPVVSDEARHKFEAAWGVKLLDEAGMSTAEMISAAGQGVLKALYILAEDLISDETDFHVRQFLETSSFVVLEEIMPSETSHYADVLLPGVSFSEKSGTFTNTERRIQMVHQAIEPLGESRPDWQIISELARRILAADGRSLENGVYSGWNYRNTSQIMAEIAALTPIYAGISHERLEQGAHLQWPVETPEHPGTRILYVSQFACDPGKFMPVEHMPPGKETPKLLDPFRRKNP